MESTELPTELDNITVVLWEPQDDINIGNTVRASKNFGVTDIRLVRPASADPETIAVSAPKAEDVIDSIEVYTELEEALADCIFVVGTTARSRAARRVVTEPRGAALEAVDAAGDGRVAYLFGREDFGLPNEALDPCHQVVTIPTNPEYTSLNLGQAVLLNVWEVFRVATDQPVEKPAIDVEPDGERFDPPAKVEMMEQLFEMAEEALHAVDFFKADETWNITRALRSVFLRARLSEREASILMGIFREVIEVVEENGSE